VGDDRRRREVRANQFAPDLEVCGIAEANQVVLDGLPFHDKTINASVSTTR
jgi:hypothetical protein